MKVFFHDSNLFSFQDSVDSGGRDETPLFIAAQHNREDMVKFLMSEFKLQGSPNSEGVTPLMVSLKEGNTEIIQLLLNPGKSRKSKGRPQLKKRFLSGIARIT